MIIPPEWPWIARMHLNSPFFILTDFEPCLDASKMKAMEPVLVRELFLQLISEISFHYWKYTIPMPQSICFSFILVMVSNHICDTLGDASLKWIPLAFRASKNYSPNSVLLGDLCLHVSGLLLFEEAGATRIVEATVSRCMLEGSTFVLTLFESCELCPWFTTAGSEDFETHIVEVVFLRAQRETLVHGVRVVTMNFSHKSFVSTTSQNPHAVSWWTQWWYLHFNTRNIHNCGTLNIFDWTNFFFCINWCVWLWILSVPGRWKFFAHRSALSPSVIIKSSCNIVVSFLDRMVQFRSCTELFNFAHKWHRIEILQFLEHSVSRCMR